MEDADFCPFNMEPVAVETVVSNPSVQKVCRLGKRKCVFELQNGAFIETRNGVKVAEASMALLSVRRVDSHSFTLDSPNFKARRRYYVADAQQLDLLEESLKQGIHDAIAGNDNATEDSCGTCGKPATWVSLSLNKLLCIECAGQVRAIPGSQVRSLTMDNVT